MSDLAETKRAYDDAYALGSVQPLAREFTAGAYVEALEAEVARLQDRERELEEDLDDCRSALGADQ